MLDRLAHASHLADQLGIRPRLAVVDYGNNPLLKRLHSLALKMNILTSINSVSRDCSTATFKDQLHRLEKSRGIHGILLPLHLTESHHQGLMSFPRLFDLQVDRGQEKPSVAIAAFLQLAAVNRWKPQNKRASVVSSPLFTQASLTLVAELRVLGLHVQHVQSPHLPNGSLATSSLVWLCHGHQVDLANLHLSPTAVIIDAGEAFGLPLSLSALQVSYLASQVQGLCIGTPEFTDLICFHLLHRLLLQALGPHRPSTRAHIPAKIKA